MATPVLLFDLGGVLIDLPPMSSMMSGSPLAEAEIRARWLHSPAVRAFECGHTDPAAFAEAMVAEFLVESSADEFLARFVAWPGGWLPGARELLDASRGEHRLACLSNTNRLHCERFDAELALFDEFDAVFVSHELGLLKPDAIIFEHVVAELETPPEDIVFFDDNAGNVDAARAAGLTGHHVRGPLEAAERLHMMTS